MVTLYNNVHEWKFLNVVVNTSEWWSNTAHYLISHYELVIS